MNSGARGAGIRDPDYVRKAKHTKGSDPTDLTSRPSKHTSAPPAATSARAVRHSAPSGSRGTAVATTHVPKGPRDKSNVESTVSKRDGQSLPSTAQHDTFRTSEPYDPSRRLPARPKEATKNVEEDLSDRDERKVLDGDV